ncbi:MFS transporter [Bosea sp. 685]|uniref:MFS transporter n=1 Tax=Bosea sp. 685 TaxID=3080057 RepID=UPI0028930EDC|nr:MFS transporter [Bosea sp. 685]WNJ89612.1 MFS transporter [Bosea sp. 685]
MNSKPESHPTAGFWASLLDPPWRWALAAVLAQHTGTWMQIVSVGWLVAEKTQSPMGPALLFCAANIPSLVFLIPSGRFADRTAGKLKVVATCLISQAIVGLVLALAVTFQAGSLAALFLAVFAFGTAEAFLAPHWHATIPELVQRPNLQSAIGLNRLAFQAARMSVPAMAGFVINLYGTTIAIYLVSITMLVSSLLFSRAYFLIGHSSPKVVSDDDLGFSVWSLLHPSHELAHLLYLVAIVNLIGSIFPSLVPIIVMKEWGGAAKDYGIMYSCYGSGAVLGIIFSVRIRKTLNGSSGVFSILFFVYACGIAVIGIADWWPLKYGLAAILGGSFAASSSLLNFYVQSELDDNRRGRVISLYLLTLFASLTVGGLVWGALGDLIGLSRCLILAGISFLLLSILVFWKNV